MFVSIHKPNVPCLLQVQTAESARAASMKEYLHHLSDIVHGRHSHGTAGEHEQGGVATCTAGGQHTAHLELPMHALPDLTAKVQRGVAPWHLQKVAFGACNSSARDVAGERCLVVQYPRGSIAPSCAKKGSPLGGLGFLAAPPAIFPASEVELSYRLQLAPTFEGQRGGKLPGLWLGEPEEPCGGGASGGRHCSQTASVRLMWRQGLAAEAYVYATAAECSASYCSQPGYHHNAKYGDSVWRGKLTLVRGGWNDVRIRVRLNTPGACDGLLAVAVNGVECACREMCWRGAECGGMMIRALNFCTFYGGSTETFACPCDTEALFKDFALHRFA